MRILIITQSLYPCLVSYEALMREGAHNVRQADIAPLISTLLGNTDLRSRWNNRGFSLK